MSVRTLLLLIAAALFICCAFVTQTAADGEIQDRRVG